MGKTKIVLTDAETGKSYIVCVRVTKDRVTIELPEKEELTPSVTVEVYDGNWRVWLQPEDDTGVEPIYFAEAQ